MLAAALLFFHACAAASVGVSDNNNVTKREVLEFYPDWVPFKNKHGEQLGEFIDVNPKAKVKKRLAPPLNFLLRAVAAPEGDDYYEKGQGDSDGGEDYFEKREWSDLHRPVNEVEIEKVPKNLDNLTDIDGVLDILTQERPSLADAINNSRPVKRGEEEYKESAREEEATTSTEAPKDDDYDGKADDEKPKEKPKVHKYEDDVEYEESPTQHEQPKKPEISEEERLENEAKKKIILDSVDELKERHAQEQRIISEKVKEDELDQEEHERELIQFKTKTDKYADRNRRRNKMTPPDYEEYEESGSWRDKYNIRVGKSTTTTSPTVTPRPTSKKVRKIKYMEPGKLSVFRNPNLYVIDENESETTVAATIANQSPETTRRFSSRYSLTTTESAVQADDPLLISLSKPTDICEGKPVLFFPKLKNKRKRKLKSTTVAPDSHVAETVEDKAAKKLTTAALDVYTNTGTTEDYKTTASADYKTTASGEEDKTTASDVDYKTTAAGSEDYGTTGPSADAETSNSNAVTDALTASSDHKKEEPQDYHVEKGGGHEHHSEHDEEHEEHGKKAYEGLHKDSKTKKGHHDKEDHLGKYEDHGGFKKEHHDGQEHYGSHHHEEHGKKHAKYEESGKHSKGHSTKGSHDIHKKEEYEKNVEFFEEDGDSAEEEKHGGYNQEKEHKLGGHYKKGNVQADHHEHKKGESGHFEKGGHAHGHKGHKSSSGHDGHGRHGGTQQSAEGHQGGKKWVYHHGFPAKTANLVIIDRRADKFSHGPNYYG
ncbi:uncharacterized protein isoform X2 [Choristoneura fumiferana]|uniref:uncharacterized protein isoform X2 n=1 Tax=Choristoneura fumiferana TaxID=7141 RepID=UPI003D15404C